MTNSYNLLMAVALIALLLAAVSLFLGIRVNRKYDRLYRQYDYFMRGRDAETLEDYFVELQKHVEALEDEDVKNKEMLRILNKNIRASFQKSGIIRYNAFGGSGGKMSFAIALLDFQNSGFVINAVHAREGSFLYIKEIEEGTTDTELGAEEKLALEQALGYRERVKQREI